MKYSFIHAADLHLGSQLKGLGAYGQAMAECYRAASARAFENLVEDAISRQVEFVVISGDIFDGDYKDFSVGLEFTRQMVRLMNKGIRVYAISGNHDNETDISKKLRLPENVSLFPARSAKSIPDERTGAVLHGQGFTGQAETNNLALAYPKPIPGKLNIGLLHTSCEGNSEHATYAPCSVEQLRNHGYDYWALGHVHNAAVLHETPYIVFPGNLQGRHIRETGAKGYVVVNVDDHEITSLEKVYCDVARWARINIAAGENWISRADFLTELRNQTAAVYEENERKPLALRISVSGETELHFDLVRDTASLREEIVNEFLSISDEIMIEKLSVRTKPPERRETLNDENAGIIDQTILEMSTETVLSEVRSELIKEYSTLKTRLPGKEDIFPSDEELEELMEQAKVLAQSYLVSGEAGVL